MDPALRPSLPLTESFEARYLEYWGILPLELADGKLRVAAVGEPAVEVLDDLAASYGAPVDLIPVSREQLVESIRRTFSAAESVMELVKDLEAEMGVTGMGEAGESADARDLAN